MNGYNSGCYNVVVTEYEPDSFNDYLKNVKFYMIKQKQTKNIK